MSTRSTGKRAGRTRRARGGRGRTTAAWVARPRWRFVRGDSIGLGPGKADLLEAIAASGSILAAGKRLGMSYRRAWMLVSTMNACFGTPLVATFARRRTGAVLTPAGQKVLRLYRRIESRSLEAARRDTEALLRLLSGR